MDPTQESQNASQAPIAAINEAVVPPDTLATQPEASAQPAQDN